jgi:hypothetical protein
LLVVFKTIKTRVEQEFARRKVKFDEDVLNEVCIEKANELLPFERDIDSSELAELIEKIALETKEKYAKQSEQHH